MDSEKALAFVRERYGLSDGDNDRGKNQEKLLAAVIQKLTSQAALANLPTVASTMAGSVQTNMPLETLMTLVNDQLDEGTSYQVTTQALDGSGSIGHFQSYAMPDASLYMVSIDQNSLAQVKSTMQATMEGH